MFADVLLPYVIMHVKDVVLFVRMLVKL